MIRPNLGFLVCSLEKSDFKWQCVLFCEFYLRSVYAVREHQSEVQSIFCGADIQRKGAGRLQLQMIFISNQPARVCFLSMNYQRKLKLRFLFAFNWFSQDYYTNSNSLLWVVKYQFIMWTYFISSAAEKQFMKYSAD